jgi:hypothetical protein
MIDPAALFLNIVIGSVGLALFLYGKKQARVPQLTVGVALMVCPYFVATWHALVAIATALLLALWWAVRAGW